MLLIITGLLIMISSFAEDKEATDVTSEPFQIELSTQQQRNREYRVLDLRSHLSPLVKIDKELDLSKGIGALTPTKTEFVDALKSFGRKDQQRYNTPFNLSDPLKLSTDEMEKLLKDKRDWVIFEHCQNRPRVYVYNNRVRVERSVSFSESGLKSHYISYNPESTPSKTEVKEELRERGVPVWPLDTEKNPPYSFKILNAQNISPLFNGFQARKIAETGEVVIYPVRQPGAYGTPGCIPSESGANQVPSLIMVPLDNKPTS